MLNMPRARLSLVVPALASLAVLLASPHRVQAEVCVGDVVLSSAADIARWSTCSTITGSLQLTQSPDITTINAQASFAHLTAVEGDVYVWQNERLTGFTGLEKLERIGGKLSILSNPALTSLHGLGSLRRIEHGLIVWDNGALESAPGMTQLEYVGGDGISFLYNNALASLRAFLPVTFHQLDGALTIRGNPALTHLAGLESLRVVRGTVELRENSALTTLGGSEQFDSADGGSSPRATTPLDGGLANLERIEGGQFILEQCRRVNDLLPMIRLKSIRRNTNAATDGSETAKTSQEGKKADHPETDTIILQLMPEVRCLPRYFLDRAQEFFLSANRPRIHLRECEDLVARFRAIELPLSISEVLHSLGLGDHADNFARQKLYVEDFVRAIYEQEGGSASAEENDAADDDNASRVPAGLWPHLLPSPADQSTFREWTARQESKWRMWRKAKAEEEQRHQQRQEL